MPVPAATDQGLLDGPHGKTWWRVTGQLGSGRTPLVVLHGGPGVPHDYTLRMARISEQGRAVVPHQVYRGDIVHAGTSEIAIGYVEARGLDDVDTKPEAGGKAQDRAGIPRDVGLVEGDSQLAHGLRTSRFCSMSSTEI